MGRQIVIVGGGIVGLCSALFARRRGHEVTVLDDRPAGHAGCSFGNAGMIVPSHFIPLAAPGVAIQGLKWMANPESPFYIRPRLSWDLLTWGLRFCRAGTAVRVRKAAPLLAGLNLESRTLYEQFAAEGLGFGLVRRGLLMLCQTQKALDEEAHVAEMAHRLDLPAQVLNRTQTDELDPHIRMDVCGSVHFPLDAHFDPVRLMTALAARAQEEGVQVLTSKPVTAIRRQNRRIEAVIAGEEFRGDEFVLAAGSWTSGLARQIGLSIPLQAGKGYSLTLPAPRQLPELCSVLTEARVAVTPMNGSLRVGGTMELSGLDDTIRERRVQGIVRSFVRYFPEFSEQDFQGIAPWAGFRPCSPDGLPYLGRSRRFENLIVATGHAMMGMSLGPVTGQIVAELASREESARELALLSPDRFG